ncbi:MAG: MarR family transcriptional regulator [Hyphomicrobiales bacterium]|nr:MarR family transcriptional regulator [Hyphomicrobiales bacterium]MDE2115649.1 MarR family transcriptional regulator [Hyphomicrobiales bacterium]
MREGAEIEREADDSEALHLEAFLPYQLVRAAEKVSLGFSSIYKQRDGLTRPEWRVLASLAQMGTANATEIGAHASLHKTKVSRAVFALEQRKWIKRREDAQDRRVAQLELTRTGKARFAGLARIGRQYEAALIERLGPREAEALKSALEQIAKMPLPERF